MAPPWGHGLFIAQCFLWALCVCVVADLSEQISEDVVAFESVRIVEPANDSTTTKTKPGPPRAVIPKQDSSEASQTVVATRRRLRGVPKKMNATLAATVNSVTDLKSSASGYHGSYGGGHGGGGHGGGHGGGGHGGGHGGGGDGGGHGGGGDGGGHGGGGDGGGHGGGGDGGGHGGGGDGGGHGGGGDGGGHGGGGDGGGHGGGGDGGGHGGGGDGGGHGGGGDGGGHGGGGDGGGHGGGGDGGGHGGGGDGGGHGGGGDGGGHGGGGHGGGGHGGGHGGGGHGGHGGGGHGGGGHGGHGGGVETVVVITKKVVAINITLITTPVMVAKAIKGTKVIMTMRKERRDIMTRRATVDTTVIMGVKSQNIMKVAATMASTITVKRERKEPSTVKRVTIRKVIARRADTTCTRRTNMRRSMSFTTSTMREASTASMESSTITTRVKREAIRRAVIITADIMKNITERRDITIRGITMTTTRATRAKKVTRNTMGIKMNMAKRVAKKKERSGDTAVARETAEEEVTVDMAVDTEDTGVVVMAEVDTVDMEAVGTAVVDTVDMEAVDTVDMAAVDTEEVDTVDMAVVDMVAGNTAEAMVVIVMDGERLILHGQYYLKYIGILTPVGMLFLCLRMPPAM
ncbi:Collagen alpha-5(VI) chain [Zootermopsis nevadensis]|uniref:Collagen alpha-5(VI) chain n=1 Tax=Zootermopsis nevadensis TaxID=136037 RepID=A0A067RMJ3_ZOONE|nr:Collagen alpha-5(VI) chain [Zootermopsis nevadensis]